MRKLIIAGTLFAALAPVSLGAQTPPPPAPAVAAPPPLEIGATAPDFALMGATRYGVLRDPVRLSDYKGKTVVLAFFFRARTRG